MNETKLPPYNPDDVTLVFSDENGNWRKVYKPCLTNIKGLVTLREGVLPRDTKQHRDWCTWKMNPSIGNEDTFCNCDAGHKD